ncbi:unnamed protein product [Echinostoma caproni]|uniref:Nuclear pore protein n=1 Tax=Echinostoma caproni TaxID=27848 RepID=A0A183BH95_9TREM|nr:unnamed protein product [Echinostoma caproni]
MNYSTSTNNVVGKFETELEWKKEELLLEEEEFWLRKKRMEFERRFESVGADEVDARGVQLESPYKPQANLMPSAGDVVQVIESSLKSLIMGISLPKIEVNYFDGSPQHYHKFVRNVEGSVADRIADDNQKLSYLLYYCRGKAREAIEHCSLLPKGDGYHEALRILRHQFGRPHDVIRAVSQAVFVGPRISSGDVESLSSLARWMRSCEVTMTPLGNAAELNSPNDLVRMTDRLPRTLQEK